ILIARTLSIDPIEEVNSIKEIASKVRKKDIEYENVINEGIKKSHSNISLNNLTYEEEKEKGQLKDQLLSLLRDNKDKLDLNVIKFEKDNDSNYHVDFIRAAANVR